MDPQREKIRLMREFNSKSLDLIGKYETSKNRDMTIVKNAAKARIVAQNTPNTLIETVGPYLYKYETPLRERKISILWDEKFEETNDLSKEGISKEEVGNFVAIMRDFWTKCSKAEQKYILDKVNEMCECYMNYLLLEVSQ